MKNLLILHGSFSGPAEQWYPYLAEFAKRKGYDVHAPFLPDRDLLNLDNTYNLLTRNNFINSETTMVGHSSGATYILGVLQKLPQDIVIDKAILVAGLIDANLTDLLFQEVPKIHYDKLFPQIWNWDKIKKSCHKFIIIHASDDPYVPIRHAYELKEKLNGELVIIPNAKHFSTGSGGMRFKEFPELLQYL